MGVAKEGVLQVLFTSEFSLTCLFTDLLYEQLLKMCIKVSCGQLTVNVRIKDPHLVLKTQMYNLVMINPLSFLSFSLVS